MILQNPTLTPLVIISILFTASLCRSTFGFGDALIAMPLITLVAGIQIATPLVAFAAMTVSTLILLTSWREIDFPSAWRLILASFVGIPFGLWLLKAAPEALVKGILGAVIILFGLYNLLRLKLPALRSHWAYAFGFVAGVLGGAYNTNGPPVVAYGTVRAWPPGRFRATLQGYFLAAGVLILGGHALGGLWTAEVVRYYVLALPAVVAAILLGSWLNRRFSPERFRQMIYGVLIILGVLLFV